MPLARLVFAGRYRALHALFDEWRRERSGEPIEGLARFGTVDWLFRMDRARRHTLAGLRVLPSVIQASEAEDTPSAALTK